MRHRENLKIEHPRIPVFPPRYPVNYHQASSLHGNKTVKLNKFTANLLRQLASFAEAIEEPPKLFDDEQYYLKILHLVLNSTFETRNRIAFFLNTIIPLLTVKEAFLDVGPGDGSLTLPITRYFKHITAIDSNNHILDELSGKLPKTVQFAKINKSITEAELGANIYNLVALSHMMYYIDSKYWLDVVKSAYRSLKINGILVIVMSGDELGKADLIKYFGGELIKIDQLAKDCCRLFGSNNTKCYVSNEFFMASTKKAMRCIGSFMLQDARISVSEDDLNAYITKKFQHSKNYFEMTSRQKYIVIRKTAPLWKSPLWL